MRQPLDRRNLHLVVQGKKINVYGWNARGTKELLIGSYEFDDILLYTDVSQDMSKVEAFLFTSIRKRMNAATSKIIFRERLTDNEEVLEILEYYKQEIESIKNIFNHNCDCYRETYAKNKKKT